MSRSPTVKRQKKKLVGTVGELQPGTSKKFTLRCGGDEVQAMLINFAGHLYAYINRCRHIGISLDWVDNQFFTADKRYLICANHGAIYEPKTGHCVWGPCAGEYLKTVPLDIDGERIYARCPEAIE